MYISLVLEWDEGHLINLIDIIILIIKHIYGITLRMCIKILYVFNIANKHID